MYRVSSVVLEHQTPLTGIFQAYRITRHEVPVYALRKTSCAYPATVLQAGFSNNTTLPGSLAPTSKQLTSVVYVSHFQACSRSRNAHY